MSDIHSRNDLKSNKKKILNKSMSLMTKSIIVALAVGIGLSAISMFICSIGGAIGLVINIITILVMIFICFNKAKSDYKLLVRLYRETPRAAIRAATNFIDFKMPLIITLVIVTISLICNVLILVNYNDNTTASIVEQLFNKDKKEDTSSIDDGYIESQYIANEGQILAEFALKEAEYYKNNSIKGGLKYWDWLDSTDCKSDWGHASQDKRLGYGWEWCATFVSYCIVQTKLDYSDGPFGDLLNEHSNIKSCGAWSSYLKNNLGLEEYKNTNDYMPQLGDIVLFHKLSGYSHIGIVVGVSGDNIYTVEGNVNGKNYTLSIVEEKTYKIGSNGSVKSGLRSLRFYHPNYKGSRLLNNENEGINNIDYSNASFNINGYTKGADGYYSPEDVEKIILDYLIIKLGLNNAAACGALGNISVESGGFKYDYLEFANWGKAYEAKDLGSRSYTVPSLSVNGNKNGNWKTVPNILETIKITGKLYYLKSRDPVAFNPYGMGYGVVQWSYGRRENLINYLTQNGTTIGENSFLSQLDFMNKELTDKEYNKSVQANYVERVYNKLLKVPNTEQGCKDAANIWASAYEICAASERPKRSVEAIKFWNKYSSYTVKTFNTNNSYIGSADVSNATIIGDSNTYRMVINNTAINNAKNILAITGVGINNYKTYKNSGCTSACKNSTLADAISKLNMNDLSNVVIMLGTNDFSSNEQVFKINYKELLNEIKNKNDQAHVIMCTIVPVNDDYSSTITNNDASTISEYIKDIAREYTGLDIMILDVNNYIQVSDMSRSSGDGYHLSISGCSKCADYITKNCYAGKNTGMTDIANPIGEDYLWPISSNRVTSTTGSRRAPVSGASTNHAGIDIGAPIGTAVKSSKSGIVVKVSNGYNGGRGNYIVVSHGNGCSTLYQHLNKSLVSVGDKVKQGQVIAESGNTGIGSGAHLHFELMENFMLINPLTKFERDTWVKAFNGDSNLDWILASRSTNRGE